MSDRPDESGAPEGRLASLLAELRDEDLTPSEGFEQSVVETARWQRALNGMLGVAFAFGGAFVEAVATLLGRRPRR